MLLQGAEKIICTVLVFIRRESKHAVLRLPKGQMSIAIHSVKTEGNGNPLICELYHGLTPD